MATEALVGRLTGECPGALSGAPETGALDETPDGSARKRGELNREQRQRAELESELEEDVSLVLIESASSQALAFAHTIASLHWTSANVSAYVHAKAAVIEWELSSTHPDVCADIRAWSGSGYRILSPATKARRRERRKVEGSEREQLESLHDPYPGSVFASFERAANKHLVDKLVALENRHRASKAWLKPVFERLQTGLGIRSQTEEHLGPPKGATVIQNGMTAAGSSFTIWITPKSEGSSAEKPTCPVSIGIEEHETHTNGSGSGGEGETCLSRQHPHGPRLECNGEQWKIEGQTVEGAQSVRLALKNGRQITSPVAIVPAADGGPVGFYYQVLSRPAQTPVSLTELDATGSALLTIKFSPKSACPKNFPKPPKPPESLPGGGIVVNGRVPHGPQFVITGSRTRFQGKIESMFDISVASEEQPGSISSGRTELLTTGERPRPKSFQLQSETGCQPHEYAILYGLLTVPRDTILARTVTGLKSLRRAPLPRSMHLHGVLAYIALSAFPTEIVVRTPAGKTVFAEKLIGQGREAKETCEGEAEGPAS